MFIRTVSPAARRSEIALWSSVEGRMENGSVAPGEVIGSALSQGDVIRSVEVDEQVEDFTDDFIRPRVGAVDFIDDDDRLQAAL